jgi:hypothetical protein
LGFRSIGGELVEKNARPDFFGSYLVVNDPFSSRDSLKRVVETMLERAIMIVTVVIPVSLQVNPRVSVEVKAPFVNRELHGVFYS